MRISARIQMSALDTQCQRQGSIHFFLFGWVQRTDEIRQLRLSYAKKAIAVNGAIALQAFFKPNEDFGSQAPVSRANWGADDG